MSGSQTISQSETRIEALKLQSSAYGITIAWLCGVNRLPGNMLWYGGFKAVPHTSTDGGGGKGGGVKVQSTTYSYTASVLMALCHGKVTGIPKIWRGKKLYDGGVTPGQVITVTENYTLPAPSGSPMVYTVSHAADYRTVVSVIANITNGADHNESYWFSQGRDFSVEDGVFTFFIVGFTGAVLHITYQYTIGAVTESALQELNLSFFKGSIGQSVWSFLTTYQPVDSAGNPVGAVGSQAVAYSGLAAVAGQDYDLGTSAQVDNHNFEVQGPMAYSLGSTIPDVDPTEALLDLLTNARYGASFPTAWLDGGMSDLSDYCVSGGLLMSPLLLEQVQAAEVVRMMAQLTNSAPITAGGKLKLVPYGDTAQAGNGRTYTPNTTPVYDLGDDNFIPAAGEPPIAIERKSPADAYNHVRIEFLNRANQYNVEIAEAKDQADIDTNGLRTMDTIAAHWICTVAVARKVAQLVLQRSLYVRATYRFKLPSNFALLLPTDLVTLTDPDLALNFTPVRLIEVAEDNEEGDLSCVAEDYPAGVASDTLYPSQGGGGYTHDYNAAPGGVDAPVFFEAPVVRTTTGLEVYAAVKGSGPLWGGCNVWVSLDGTNYKQIATLHGPARYGSLTGPIASGSLPVSTSGKLVSGSAADAAALNTLCYIGGATPEYLAYTTATLTGPGAYTLAGLVRGAYGTSGTPAHATSDPFVRVDNAIAKSGSLDLAMIGKTIQFKFTSFNIFGSAEESLAVVTAYSYKITGKMAALPPSAPSGLGYAMEPFGVRLSCAKNPEPDVVGYEWRVGAAWLGATVLERRGGTSHLWAVQTSGTFTAWVAAIDALGNYSAPSSVPVTVSAGSIGSLAATIVGPDLQLDYVGLPGAFATAGYELRFGDVFTSATVVGFFYVTRHLRRVDWVDNRRWWVVPVDVKGNYGTQRSVDVSIDAPGAVTASRSEVIDNNALLYWAAPATGSLPVDRYEVRKGTTWAGGTVVGSNGNSTFAAIFEQASGLYTYWVAAFDTAGNVGDPVGINATINQPPDYVLRKSWDSTFSGTLTNLYAENGKLIGPVTSQTWATHFSSNGWSTIGDQIAAGYPLYAEPSTTSGSYDETFNYGAVLPATTVTATLGYTVLDGSITVACQIYYKKLVGDPWTAATAGATSIVASNFQYVRVVWTFTCTAGANLIKVSSFNLKLSSKLRTDSGTFTITTASTGVVVNFNIPFIDADTPMAQAAGTTPLTPVVDFTDVPNPTSFTVYLYNAAGSKVTGSGSWTARGY